MSENTINNDGDAAPLALIAALPTQAERDVMTVFWAEEFQPAKASTNVFMKWSLGIKAHTCFCLQWIKDVRAERIKFEGVLAEMNKAKATLYAPAPATTAAGGSSLAALVEKVEANTKAVLQMTKTAPTAGDSGYAEAFGKLKTEHEELQRRYETLQDDNTWYHNRMIWGWTAAAVLGSGLLLALLEIWNLYRQLP